MGSDAFLYYGKEGMMYSKCPKCGEIVPVYQQDISGTTTEGANEYFIRCDDCGYWFHASTDY